MSMKNVRTKMPNKVEVDIKDGKIIDKILLVNTVVSYAVSALETEVMAHPKCGLVTGQSQGKHSDMDYSTFLTSIDAIKPFFYEYADVGFELDENTFSKLREIGIRAEKAMFKATSDINTHKGIIFLLGFLIPSVIDVVYNKKEFHQISENIKFLGKDLLKDFENIENKQQLTYGEKVYLQYGITGIRGVVFSGMNVVFDIVEKFKTNESDENTLVINILLECMTKLDDTVILHKNTLETLKYVKQKSLEIIKIGGFNTEAGRDAVFKFTDECIEKNISPGGSADLVSVILILLKVKEELLMMD